MRCCDALTQLLRITKHNHQQELHLRCGGSRCRGVSELRPIEVKLPRIAFIVGTDAVDIGLDEGFGYEQREDNFPDSG